MKVSTGNSVCLYCKLDEVRFCNNEQNVRSCIKDLKENDGGWIMSNVGLRCSWFGGT